MEITMPCKYQQNQSRQNCNNIKQNRTQGKEQWKDIRAKTYFTLIKINIYRKAVSAMNFYAPNNIALIHKAKTTRYTRKKW